LSAARRLSKGGDRLESVSRERKSYGNINFYWRLMQEARGNVGRNGGGSHGWKKPTWGSSMRIKGRDWGGPRESSLLPNFVLRREGRPRGKERLTKIDSYGAGGEGMLIGKAR